jgi:hypothetical protein
VKSSSPEHLDDVTLGGLPRRGDGGRGRFEYAAAHIKVNECGEAEVARAVDARTMSGVFAMPRCKMIDAVQR